jgi:hypothetical protein
MIHHLVLTQIPAMPSNSFYEQRMPYINDTKRCRNQQGLQHHEQPQRRFDRQKA